MEYMVNFEVFHWNLPLSTNPEIVSGVVLSLAWLLGNQVGKKTYGHKYYVAASIGFEEK